MTPQKTFAERRLALIAQKVAAQRALEALNQEERLFNIRTKGCQIYEAIFGQRCRTCGADEYAGDDFTACPNQLTHSSPSEVL